MDLIVVVHVEINKKEISEKPKYESRNIEKLKLPIDLVTQHRLQSIDSYIVLSNSFNFPHLQITFHEAYSEREKTMTIGHEILIA